MRSFLATIFAASSALAAVVPVVQPDPASELGWHNSSNAAHDKRANTQVVSQCTVSGQVALTFDDGPYSFESTIRGELGGSVGTFFLNGNNWGCIYDRADDIIAAHNAGWTLGNHGYSHAHMGALTWDQAHNELWLVEQAFIKILGLKPLYFRPPYGEMSPTLQAVLANRGYKKAFIWSDDTQDSDGATPEFSKNIYTQIAKTYPQPHLILNHETIQTTSSQVIPYAVPLLKQAGYKLVAVDTCLGSGGEWPYQYVGEPQKRDSSWTCVPPLRN